MSDQQTVDSLLDALAIAESIPCPSAVSLYALMLARFGVTLTFV